MEALRGKEEKNNLVINFEIFFSICEKLFLQVIFLYFFFVKNKLKCNTNPCNIGLRSFTFSSRGVSLFIISMLLLVY